jgi:hypothetical protein
MVDTYSKIVLTVIAVALVALVFQEAVPNARAAFADCGRSAVSPCYMKIAR